MTKIKNVLFLLLIAGICPAMAEDEDKRSLFLGIDLNDGNTETETYKAEVKTDMAVGDGTALINAAYNYGETDGSNNVDNASASAQYNLTLSDPFYGLVNVGYQKDEIADLDYRVTLGPGVGTHLIKNDASALSVEVGPQYIWEEVAGVSDDYLAIRFAERFTHKLSETASIYQSVEFVPEAEDFDNYLLNAEIGVEAALNSTMNLRVALKDTYDSTPAPTKDENDLSLSAGLVYNF